MDLITVMDESVTLADTFLILVVALVGVAVFTIAFFWVNYRRLK